MKNKSWLRYSQRIAMMILDKMEEMNMTRKQLSELMGGGSVSSSVSGAGLEITQQLQG